MKKVVDGVVMEMTPEEVTEHKRLEAEYAEPNEVTLESLDHRLSDVEYIITGEVATNAQ